MDLRPGHGQRSGTSRERGGPAPSGASKTANPFPSPRCETAPCSCICPVLRGPEAPAGWSWRSAQDLEFERAEPRPLAGVVSGRPAGVGNSARAVATTGARWRGLPLVPLLRPPHRRAGCNDRGEVAGIATLRSAGPARVRPG
jgi:hypothetical protein